MNIREVKIEDAGRLVEIYSEVAHFKKIGKKFDRWYDLKWYQKVIG